MGDILTLDDGRTFSRSSFEISGLLKLVAQYLPDGHDQLKLWLNDVSDRTNGMMGIDLRGLTPESRSAFHEGARAAFEVMIVEGAEITDLSYALGALNAFIEMQNSICRGDPPVSLSDHCVSTSEPYIEDITEIQNPKSV